MYINHQWKRGIALSCNHGHLCKPEAVEAALLLTEEWKPERRIHLGDNWDTAPWRTGAPGTKDESERIAPDHNAGLEFLRLFKFTDFILGNHDIRLWRALQHHNAIVAECARQLVAEIYETCEAIDCKVYDRYSARQPGFRIANTQFLHGFANGMYAAKKHAQAYGRCVHGHNHSVMALAAENLMADVGHCVGALADFDKLEYSLASLATLRQTHGIAQLEFNENHCEVILRQIIL